MSKVAVLLADYFEDIEFSSPVESLKNAGNEVVVVGIEPSGSVSGKHGLIVQADKGIDEVSTKDFDAVFVPGGFSPDVLREDVRMIEFVKEFFCQINISFLFVMDHSYLSKPAY